MTIPTSVADSATQNNHDSAQLQKPCSKCGELLPATLEFFSPQLKGKYGLRANCRKCKNSYAKTRYESNVEFFRKRQQERNVLRPHKSLEEIRESRRQAGQARRQSHFEKLAAHGIPDGYKQCPRCKGVFPRTAEYFQRNSSRASGIEPTCKKCHYLSARESQNKHPDRIREYQRRWSDKNRDLLREHARQYRLANPEKARLAAQRRRSLKRSQPVSFTSADWLHALDYFGGCCAYCNAQAGLLEWGDITADHFVAVISPDCPGTVPTNMIPACRACNSSKGSKDAKEWVVSRFGTRKGSAILKRITLYFASLSTNAELEDAS